MQNSIGRRRSWTRLQHDQAGPERRQRPTKPVFIRKLDESMEKRLLRAIVVNLTQERHRTLNETELTYTENISAHGACVISCRPWDIDEMAEVTALEDELALLGRVAHCQKRDEDRYAVGLAFRDHACWPHAGARKADARTELATSL